MRLACLAFTACLAISAHYAHAQEEEPTARQSPLQSLELPDGFLATEAAGPELTSYPMFMELDPQGRLYLAESSGKDLSGAEMVAAPECTILRLTDEDGDGTFDSKTVFADKLSLPMGVLWHQGRLFVASPPDLIAFDDKDGDGVAENREVLLSGWNVLNTASLHGPYLGPDGWLYLTHGRHGFKITRKEGDTLEGKAARIWRCRPDGTGLESVAGGGFDNPVELIFTPGAEMIGTMTYFTDPRNGQRDGLMHWVEGGVYPKPGDVTEEFIRTGDLMPTMTKFARIAPAGLAQYKSRHFGPEYRDNLFSAQFNPHRIQRHRLFRTGATFRTEDEDFLTSSDPDFHPTDVLEDADGTLLISDTGGWYVDACPISRVARPEVRGRIFRIQRINGYLVSDPWGRELKIETLAPNELVRHLADERSQVAKAALERLVSRGAAATVPLTEFLRGNAKAEARTNALWALHRIGTAESQTAVRSVLGDKDPLVQVAAAHSVAMAADAEAVSNLTPLLTAQAPEVRREAATALGGLKGGPAASALLTAAGEAVDRFEEHAVIYALIQTGQRVPVVARLSDDTPGVRKAALIALDQMDPESGKSLQQDQLLAFLADEDPELRKTGLWVASRHPEWSEAVLENVETRLHDREFSPESAASIREVLLAYASEPAAQDKIAELLGDPVLELTRRMFLLEVIDTAPVAKFPDSWVEQLGRFLQTDDGPLRFRAVQLLDSRNIDAHDQELARIADSSQESVALRLAALATIVKRQPTLTPERWEFLVAQMNPQAEPAQRLTVYKILADAELDSVQALTLAQDYLPKADPLAFSGLLDVFRGGKEEAVGLALVRSLAQAEIQPGLIPGGIDALLEGYPPAVLEAAAPLRAQAKEEEEKRVARLLQLEPALGSGDVGRGRALFFGEKAACSTCHAVGEEGGRLGPDLTTIGAVRTGHDLLEAILFPSASFVPDYEPYRVDTDEDIYLGVITRQSPDTITIATGVNQENTIARADIVQMRPHTVSIMPEGLDVTLTPQELIDLVSFMQSLNNEEWLLPEQRNNKQAQAQ